MKNLKSIEDTYEAGEISKKERDTFIHYYHLGRESGKEEALKEDLGTVRGELQVHEAIDALIASAQTRGEILEQHTDVLEDLIATTKIQEAISQKQTSILEDLVLDYEKRRGASTESQSEWLPAGPDIGDGPEPF